MTCNTGSLSFVFQQENNSFKITKNKYNCKDIINKELPDIIINISALSEKNFWIISDFIISINDKNKTLFLKIKSDLSGAEGNVSYSIEKTSNIIKSPIPLNFLPSNNFIVTINNSEYRSWVIQILTYNIGVLLVTIKYIENHLIKFKTIELNTLIKNTVIKNPSIYINGSTLIDGSDVGEVIFDIIYDNKLIKFEKSCIKIKSLVIGDKSKLIQKIGNIWNNSNNSNNSNNDFDKFFQNFLIYSMLRYILSKMLYGNFFNKYLLQKYYKNFMIDLEKSVFSNFIDFFNSPTYSEIHKYYK